MATLTIRNVDAAVKERLRVRAARHGRSMEAEARTILSDAVAAEPDASEPNLAEAIRRRFAPIGGKLATDHPLTAPAYSERRSTMAKEIGLGRPRQAVARPPAPEVVAPATPGRGRKPRSAAAE
jgi:antitoxin FitA